MRDGDPGRRDQGVGAVQHRHRRRQGRVVLLFIAFGARASCRRQLAPVHPGQRHGRGVYGWSGILRGAGVVFFAYIGFDAVSTAAQEARTRSATCRSASSARSSSARSSTSSVSLILTGVVHYTQLERARPDRRRRRGDGLSVALAVVELGADRRADVGDAGDAPGPAAHLLLDGGRRPASAGVRVEGPPPDSAPPTSRRSSPAWWWRSRRESCRSAFWPAHDIGTLFAFALVSLGVMVLRIKRPELPRAFRVPGGPTWCRSAAPPPRCT